MAISRLSRLVDEFSQTRIPLVFKDGAIPNIEPREHIRPTHLDGDAGEPTRFQTRYAQYSRPM